MSSLQTYLEGTGLDIKTADRYFKIHRTVIEMLSDRGYSIPVEEASSTKSMLGFLKYLFDRKVAEDVAFLQIFLNDLLVQGFIKDPQRRLNSFVRENLPVLASRLDPKEIADEIEETFETTSKLGRSMEDVVKDRLAGVSNRSIEFLNQIYERTLNETIEKIYVYYFYNVDTKKEEAKLRINDVILKITSVQEDVPNLKDVLFVAEKKMNTQMVDDLKKYKEKMRVDIFMADHLLFNLTKHFLVPKHHLMTDQEQKEFLKDKERAFTSYLPKIYEIDPVARYYGAKVGQIFKIIRESLSDDSMVKTSEFYRYVVPEMKK